MSGGEWRCAAQNKNPTLSWAQYSGQYRAIPRLLRYYKAIEGDNEATTRLCKAINGGL